MTPTPHHDHACGCPASDVDPDTGRFAFRWHETRVEDQDGMYYTVAYHHDLADAKAFAKTWSKAWKRAVKTQPDTPRRTAAWDQLAAITPQVIMETLDGDPWNMGIDTIRIIKRGCRSNGVIEEVDPADLGWSETLYRDRNL